MVGTVDGLDGEYHLLPYLVVFGIYDDVDLPNMVIFHSPPSGQQQHLGVEPSRTSGEVAEMGDGVKGPTSKCEGAPAAMVQSDAHL